MPIIILPLTLACLCYCLYRGSVRDALLRAFVVFGVLIVLLTEVLGAFNALRYGPAFCAWSIAAVVAAALAYRVRTAIPRPKITLLDGALIGGICVISLITLVIALVSPPNSADAMAYHLPRVVYWTQQQSVRFFPTPYLNQIMLQPFAEYVMLHTWLLSGGDRFVNLVQWTASVMCVLGVSAIAAELGASMRGQTLAALFCATLPNGILQASGAKNDYVLALWLVCMVYFALRLRHRAGAADIAALGAALGLALLTKATAYLFVPALLAASLLPLLRQRPPVAWRLAAVCVACVLALNGPLYWRNLDLSGSPLGFDSAQADGRFRWRNEHFGIGVTLSNVARNTSEQLGARSPAWNHSVYGAIRQIHAWIGMSIDDPSTTWPDATYKPPKNANHEADANNRWHLLLLLAAGIALVMQRQTRALALLAAVIVAFIAFSAYLKWQPFLARMFLPLFVLASPAGGLAAGRIRPAILQALLCLFLLNNARPYLFENWVRPIKGPKSVLTATRDQMYFADMTQWDNAPAYFAATDRIVATNCQTVGIDANYLQLEYPLMALLQERVPGILFTHTGVRNPSARYAPPTIAAPCAVVCMDCAGHPDKLAEYETIGPATITGRFVVFGR